MLVQKKYFEKITLKFFISQLCDPKVLDLIP